MGLGRYFELGSSNLFNVKVGDRVIRHTLLSGVLFTAAIGWIVWVHGPLCDPLKLGTWLLLSLAVMAMRIGLLFSWKHADENGNDFAEFSDELFTGAVASGLLWGVAGFMFLPEIDDIGKLYLLFCLVVLSIKAVPPLHSSYLCYLVFAVAMWLPTAFAATGERESKLIFSLAVATILSAVYSCRLLRSAFHSLDETRNIEREKATQMDKESAQRRLFFLAANHDLGQPLTTIQYELKRIREVAKDNGLLRSPVVTIDESIKTLQRLIQDIIQYEKVSAGIVKAERTVVSIQQIFTMVVNHVSHLASVKELGLWARPTGKQVLSDPFILERIVRNLVENALRYTKSGRVVMAARRRGGRTCIEVWDSGVGISAEDAEQIFDIHFRAEATKDMHGGSGLGLSIVRRLADSIGAEICKPVSIPGRGTVFRLVFPQWAQVDDIYMPYKQDDALSRPPSVAGLHVMVVDDDVALGSAIESDLREAGGHAVFYQGSSDAERALASSPSRVDVLLTDWQLVGETGADVYKRLMETECFKKWSPIWIIMSGNIESDIAAKLRANGTVVLGKPFEPSVLIDHLSLLAQSRAVNVPPA